MCVYEGESVGGGRLGSLRLMAEFICWERSSSGSSTATLARTVRTILKRITVMFPRHHSIKRYLVRTESEVRETPNFPLAIKIK